MNIQLIDGKFNPHEALDIIAQMIQVKIRFHESKIQSSQHAEDIKARENKIKQLQNQLHEARNHVNTESNVSVAASVQIVQP